MREKGRKKGERKRKRERGAEEKRCVEMNETSNFQAEGQLVHKQKPEETEDSLINTSIAVHQKCMAVMTVACAGESISVAHLRCWKLCGALGWEEGVVGGETQHSSSVACPVCSG